MPADRKRARARALRLAATAIADRETFPGHRRSRTRNPCRLGLHSSTGATSPLHPAPASAILHHSPSPPTCRPAEPKLRTRAFFTLTPSLRELWESAALVPAAERGRPQLRHR